MKPHSLYLASVVLGIIVTGSQANAGHTSSKGNTHSYPVFHSEPSSEKLTFTEPSPWLEIRKKRITTLLPRMMDKTQLKHWLIVCRENNNDPIAGHVGCENAGGTAVVLFSRTASGVTSRIFSPVSESTALKELAIFDSVIDVAKEGNAIASAAQWLKSNIKAAGVAINSFSDNPQADGLSHSQYIELKKFLSDSKIELVSSETLIFNWLARKLSEEVRIMSEAADITSQWQYEAYETVIPGVTTDKDLANFLKRKIAEAGVQDGWSPSQNPAVNSGPDRGHSHPTNRVIQPGDVIQIDFGIRVYDQWVTDIQRFAYVLRPNETEAPPNIQHAWDSALQGSQTAFKKMKPGITGKQVHKAQKEVMNKAGSLPVMWSTGHPVGYVAHDSGPNLGVRSTSDLELDVGMTFAFDGFFSWEYPGNNQQRTKTISVEEMVVIKEEGAVFLIKPQTSLILISGKNN